MKNKFKITMMLVFLANILCAQNLLETKPIDNNNNASKIVTMRYEKKSPAKAALLSSLFPGAGQYYSESSTIGTIVFPVIEIALWAGYFHFHNEATQKERDYEKYVDKHYSRERQLAVQNHMINIIPAEAPDDWEENHTEPYYDDIYTKDFFRLDGIRYNENGTTDIFNHNTQHFYEDVGKYNKYVFGWDDWFARYVQLDESRNEWDGSSGTWLPSDNGSYYVENIEWVWSPSAEDSNHTWSGNVTANTNVEYDSSIGIVSANRDKYIKMRKDAEDVYDLAHYCTWGILANHMVSAIHAAYVTKKRNLTYLSQQKPYDVKIASILVNNRLTPALSLNYRF